LGNPITLTDRLGLQVSAPSAPNPIQVPVPDIGKEFQKRLATAVAVEIAIQLAEAHLPPGELRDTILVTAGMLEIGQGLYITYGSAGLALASAATLPVNPLGVGGIGLGLAGAAAGGKQVASGIDRIYRVLDEQYRREQAEEVERLRRERQTKKFGHGQFGRGR
jgi:hypothetical protein